MITITKLVIGDKCLHTYPCQHYITITLNDGTEKQLGVYGTELQALVLTLPSAIIQGTWCHYTDEELEHHLGKDYDVYEHLAKRIQDVDMHDIEQ